jgi:hypothetical protein
MHNHVGNVCRVILLQQVTTHTGDVRNAGTDARVHVDIRGGSSSCSGPQALSKPITTSSSSSSRNCFERGQADSFEVACRELGELSELTVWHDGSDFGSGWHLAYVEVQHVQSGQVSVWACSNSNTLVAAVLLACQRRQVASVQQLSVTHVPAITSRSGCCQTALSFSLPWSLSICCLGLHVGVVLPL